MRSDLALADLAARYRALQCEEKTIVAIAAGVATEAQLGDDFRIRDFHDALMAAVAVALPVREALIGDWIAGAKRACVTDTARQT